MELKVEYVPLGEIRPYHRNAKLHPTEQIEQIKNSMREFGNIDPIGVWHGEIVEGHGRYLAAKELGCETVPVIRLDELSDEQRRAYALIHNQLTLNSGFDEDLLDIEMEDLPDMEWEDFGFDFSEEESGGYYGDERERTGNAYNMDLIDRESLTNDFWQMPVIRNDGVIPEALIGFNYAKTSKRKDAGIHFYLDDYQFERVWRAPERYTAILAEYPCILSPDFSLYMDMPIPLKIWNVYRSRQIGAFYQRQGIKVIPTVSWAEPKTFSFCFQGIPKGSVVSISTVGVKESAGALKVWHEGVDAMLEAIEPSSVLIYGGKIEHDFGGAQLRYYENAVTRAWKKSVEKGKKAV